MLRSKKIAFISIFDNVNFGTYLQCVALSKVLLEMNCDVELINYQRPHKSLESKIKEVLSKNIIRITYNLFYKIPRTTIQQKVCRQFVEKYVETSRLKYKSFEQLLNHPPLADIYMTGSDQVWNSIYNRGIDRSFFLDFAPKDKPRVSYAASIGMDRFPEEEKKTIKELLKKYSAISVRELKAKELLENLGLMAEVVLDPTLLLNKNDWKSFIVNSEKPKEDYLLIYSVETSVQNTIITKIAKKIVAQKNLSIYNVSYHGVEHNEKLGDRNFYRASPQTFLNLIYHAKFVLVSSFHGTAFSINLNKQFLSVTPNRFNSRVMSLLKLCNLEERLVKDEEFDIEKLREIGYEKVNDILAEQREKSISFLKKAIDYN